MQFTRSLSKCSTCPLEGRKKVQGIGSIGHNGVVAFYGTAPTRADEEKEEPFNGTSGTYLNWVLLHAGIERSRHWVSNILPCRPPEGNWDSFEVIEAIEACGPGIEQELKALEKAGVKVIVPLGWDAANYFGITQGGIEKTRGSVYKVGNLWAVPTYHPNYFGKMSRKKGDDSILDKKVTWVSDIQKAMKIGEQGWVPPEENFNLFPTPGEVEAWVQDALLDGVVVGVDIETSGLNREYSKVIVIGLARDGENGISVPFLSQGGKSYFDYDGYSRVQHSLNTLFKQGRLMFQNALFDVGYLKGKGYTISYENVEHDTMLLHHTIVPEQAHNLQYIVSIYGDTPAWKSIFSDREGRALDMSDEDLRIYNLRDTVVLHQVLGPMIEDAKERGVYELYQNEVIPLLAPIGEMMETGLRLDTKRLEEVKDEYERRLVRLDKKLRRSSLGKIPPAFNFDSAHDMQWLAYSTPPSKFKKLEALKEYEPETCTKHTKDGKPRLRKKGTATYERLAALKEISTGTPHLIIPKGWKPRKTDKGADGADEQVFLSLAVAMGKRRTDMAKFRKPKQAHIEELKAYDRQDAWLELYREYRQVGKILSTYTSYDTWEDGKVHTSFIIHGTATGRLSSRDPNFQNLPKKDDEDSVGKEIREVFTASKGKVLVSCDYSNLEVRILAYTTMDAPLIRMLETGVNLHDDNAKTLFNLNEKDKKWKLARSAAKVFQFGAIQYGGGDREVFEKTSMKAPALGLKFGEFVIAKQRWMAAHPGYSSWAAKVKQQAIDTRISEVFNGRKRELMGRDRDIEKQALNTPIQGGAAAVINRATIEIYKEKPYNWRLVLQIHDQLVMEVPEGDAKACIAFMKKHMEEPVVINGAMRTFPVDTEVGHSLGTLEEVEV